MESFLPINVEDLLRARGVETQRLEFKGTWDDHIAEDVLHTICAFANDVHNVNGGYIIVGVDEDRGRAVLPPRGLDPAQLDQIQRQIRVHCKTLDPEYQPVLSPELVDGRYVLVIWAPGSEIRPHQTLVSLAKKEQKPPEARGKAYYVRLGSATVKAEGSMLIELIGMAAKVPFDDRQARQFTLNDIRATLVREFLHDVRSSLLKEADDAEVYRRMRITSRVNGHEVPRNVALLLFSDDPERLCPGARIEVAHYTDDARGNVIEEQVFRGPLLRQLRDCLHHLHSLSTRHIRKQASAPETTGWASYPFSAMDEAVVNAVYHRSYQEREPTKIHLYPDRIEIISYPGPVPGLGPEHFLPGRSFPPKPARNRRIGEFLKELGLAEARYTGLPKIYGAMAENGSPAPRFDFDESYFRVTLPAHAEYLALQHLREAALLLATGEEGQALSRLTQAHLAAPYLGHVAAQLISLLGKRGARAAAKSVYERFQDEARKIAPLEVENAMAEVDGKAAGRWREARDVDWAVMEAERSKSPRRVHRILERAGEQVLKEPKALYLFAWAKFMLARGLRGAEGAVDQDTRRRLLREARELLERLPQVGPVEDSLAAAAWYLLGRVLRASAAPVSEIQGALERACALQPEEPRFQRALARQRQRRTDTHS
jgi:ATP-dependent DNA helicase RecG